MFRKLILNNLKNNYFHRNLNNSTITYTKSQAKTMVKKALVFLAEGAEEMETVILVDMLRRAEINVTLAGVKGDAPVICSRNVRIVPDKALSSVANDCFDAVIIPGGLKGAEACGNDEIVGSMIKKHFEEKKLVAAVCAGPTAFLAHKFAFGKSITSYPSFKEKLSQNYNYKEDRVVQDENLITSQGPGTCFEFALKIIEYLAGAEKSKSLVQPMILKL